MIHLPYSSAELQCRICPAKYGPTAHVPDIIGGTLRKQKLVIIDLIWNILFDKVQNKYHNCIEKKIMIRVVMIDHSRKYQITSNK